MGILADSFDYLIKVVFGGNFLRAETFSSTFYKLYNTDANYPSCMIKIIFLIFKNYFRQDKDIKCKSLKNSKNYADLNK